MLYNAPYYTLESDTLLSPLLLESLLFAASSFNACSSPLMSSLCLIMIKLVMKAVSASAAFRINTERKPRVYPIFIISFATDSEIPDGDDDEFAEFRRDGSLMIDTIVDFGNERDDIEERRELFLE